jgi:hypothetical protein
VLVPDGVGGLGERVGAVERGRDSARLDARAEVLEVRGRLGGEPVRAGSA